MTQFLTKEQQEELTKACEHMIVYNHGKIGDGCCTFGYMVCICCGRLSGELNKCKYQQVDGGEHCKHPSIYTKLKVGGMLIG